jgi:hypothetical protein
MKAWIKILSLLPILAIEGIVIVLGIPELSLIAGALLLITVLIAYTFIQELWTQEKTARNMGREEKAGKQGSPVPTRSVAAGEQTAPGQRPDIARKIRFPFLSSRTKSPDEAIPEQVPKKKRRFPFLSSRTKSPDEAIPEQVPKKKRRFPFPSSRTKSPDEAIPEQVPKKKRRFPFLSSRTKSPDEAIPEQVPKKKRRFPFLSSRTKSPDESISVRDSGKDSRFPTFSAMVEGVRRLGHGLRASTGKQHRDSAGESPLQDLPDRAGISLASVRADPAAPVPVKQEPSPFSPLIGDSGLDADLIHRRKEAEGSGILDEPGFDEDFPDIEIQMPEGVAEGGESSDDVSSLAFDDERDDAVPATPGSFPDDTPPGTAGELSLDEELDNLDQLGLDAVGLEPVAVTPDHGQSPDKEQTFAKKMRESDVRKEYMSDFSPEQGKDADLLSSLSTDMQGSRKRANSSLVRDMKDIRVQVHEIEEELLSFLQAK